MTTCTCTTASNTQGLLYIEYGFHRTLILSGLALAYCFVSLARQWSVAPAPSESPEAPLAGDPASIAAG